MKFKSILQKSDLLNLSILIFYIANSGQAADFPNILKINQRGTETGNGAAVILREGEVLTIGSQDLRVSISPLRAEQIPGLSTLINGLKNLGLTGERKLKLLESINATSERRYFSVSSQSIDDSTLKRISDVYSETLRTKKGDFEIAAITQGKETYLLPSFFKLESAQEQAAILAHEAAWVLKPEAEYLRVLDLESSVKRYLKDRHSGYDPQLYDVLEFFLDDLMLDGLIAVGKELEKLNRTISLRQFLGESLTSILIEEQKLRRLEVLVSNSSELKSIEFKNHLQEEMSANAEYQSLYHEIWRIRDRLKIKFMMNQEATGSSSYDWSTDMPTFEFALNEQINLTQAGFRVTEMVGRMSPSATVTEVFLDTLINKSPLRWGNFRPTVRFSVSRQKSL